MTWDEIYERADGTACGDPELRAKDEARGQVRETMMELGFPDLEDYAIPEEMVDEYCEKYQIRFDEGGNIIDLRLPGDIEEMIYRRKADEYLKEDIAATIGQMKEREELPPCFEITYEGMNVIVAMMHKAADCNVPYNNTLEMVIMKAIKGEKDGKSN